MKYAHRRHVVTICNLHSYIVMQDRELLNLNSKWKCIANEILQNLNFKLLILMKTGNLIMNLESKFKPKIWSS